MPDEKPASDPGAVEFTKKVTVLKRKFVSAIKEIKLINDQGRLASAIDGMQERPKFFGMYPSLGRWSEKVEGIWDDLHEIYILQGLEGEFPKKNELELYETAKRYFYESSTAYTSLTTKHLETFASLNTTTPEQKRPVAYLPKITLPTFSGEIVEWPRFRDTFLSLVHNEPSLTGMEKFHYLSSSLAGPAYATIQYLPLLENNYLLAWEALKKVYDNKRLLASTYLDRLVQFRPLQGKPTRDSLRSILSQISDNINAFKQLAIPNESDFVLFHLAVRCLDPTTREAFELNHADDDYPSFDSLMQFVRSRFQALEMTFQLDTKPRQEESKPQSRNSVQPPKTRTFILAEDKSHTEDNAQGSSCASNQPQSPNFQGPPCYICNRGRHPLFFCFTFKRMDPTERRSRLVNWGGCHNCLSYGHVTKHCKSEKSCRECKQQHHTFLHLKESKTMFSSNHTLMEEEVFLGTALARIKDAKGASHTVRLVMDCGSQHCLITSDCVKLLGLQPTKGNRIISGVGETELTATQGSVSCIIKPVHDENQEIIANAIVVDKITHQLPQIRFPPGKYQAYFDYKLADPSFYKPGPIHFLLGADLFFDVLTGTPITVQQNLPRLTPSVFGHIVAGKSTCPTRGSHTTTLLGVNLNKLPQIVERFWMLDEVQTRRILSREDKECEEHFVNTHSRTDGGRYIVSLPFRKPTPTIADSRNQALTRLINLETRFIKNPGHQLEYNNFMSEYLSLGHMALAKKPSIYVIPHHGVFKGEGSKVKLRVVFDASSNSNRSSLNQSLLAGPKLQLDIGIILLNFRFHKFVLVADIVKMFRQILIHPSDRKYQHIYWRYNNTGPIDEYELSTLTYGMTSSPYLAIRVIKQLVADEGLCYPAASKALEEDIYVDDILTGASTLADVLLVQAELIALLGKGGFQLSKWASNCQPVLDAVAERSCNTQIDLDIEDDKRIKLLGLQWDPRLDVFSYQIKPPLCTAPTKRLILSTIARIYDPLGYLAPVVFCAKHIFQQTWLSKLDWDEQVPHYIATQWERFNAELNMIFQVEIPRHIPMAGSNSIIVLGFCDASLKGYAAAMYLRVSFPDDPVQTFLIKAKTKLAPIKPMSVPRLELCGALLLSRLYISIKPSLNKLKVSGQYWFTDSTDVIGWARTDPNRLKSFVAHRVVEIAENLNTTKWYHVTSKENPADCASRGLPPSEFVSHPIWLSGPKWLNEEEGQWPISMPNETDGKELSELKSVTTAMLASHSKKEDVLTMWISRFSSYSKMLRSFALCRRYVSRLRFGYHKITGHVTIQELDEARESLIRHSQASLDLSSLRALKPYTDETGIVRVGGRLANASIPADSKHPILLPGNCHFTQTLVDHYHKVFLHLGHSALQCFLRRTYWITPSMRNLIRSRIFHCLKCYKSSHSPQPPVMGDLPRSRLTEGRIFLHAGVDYAGPFFIRESNRRKAAIGKAYLCLFVCMTTKAIHLELVSNCTTEAFLATLDRFIARRGKPAHIYSDNGSNFIGAFNQIKDLYAQLHSKASQDRILDYSTALEIKWSFNPPSAPHFGGLWEAGVKSVKTILKRVMNSTPFTFEELTTMLCRIEAILNSRPLCPMYSDVQSYDYLTPGHFIIGAPLTARPEDSVLDVAANRLSRWQLIQQRVQHFWKRWRTEYLHNLQQRPKWLKDQPSLSIGDLVIVGDHSSPPLQWPTARISELHPGKDGVVRVVTLQTPSSTFKRPVHNIVPLIPVNISPSPTLEPTS